MNLSKYLSKKCTWHIQIDNTAKISLAKVDPEKHHE